MRHAFRILAELGAECDRLGVRAVDERGDSGPASEFLAKIIHYIEARERECDRATLTDEERHAIAIVRNCALTRAERFLTQSDSEREATLVLWRLRERLG